MLSKTLVVLCCVARCDVRELVVASRRLNDVIHTVTVKCAHMHCEHTSSDHCKEPVNMNLAA